MTIDDWSLIFWCICAILVIYGMVWVSDQEDVWEDEDK